MSKSEVKQCPKCGGEMEIGYLRDAPYWRRGKNLLQIGFGPRVFTYIDTKIAAIQSFIPRNKGKK